MHDGKRTLETTVDIPNWAMKIFIEAAERSYRRGFQHGLLQGERSHTPHNDPKVSRWRSAEFKLSDRDGTPYDPNSSTIEMRHIGTDGPRCHLHRESRNIWRLWRD